MSNTELFLLKYWVIRGDALVFREIKVVKLFLSIFLVGITLMPLNTQAKKPSQEALETKVAVCPELPNVSWWKTTRIKIVKYVDLKYLGNWVPYIKKWETYKQKMQSILASNGTAWVKSRDIRLSGKKLAFHIQEIERRLEVTKCLKSIFSGQLADVSQSQSVSAGVILDIIIPGFVFYSRMQIYGGFNLAQIAGVRVGSGENYCMCSANYAEETLYGRLL